MFGIEAMDWQDRSCRQRGKGRKILRSKAERIDWLNTKTLYKRFGC